MAQQDLEAAYRRREITHDVVLQLLDKWYRVPDNAAECGVLVNCTRNLVTGVLLHSDTNYGAHISAVAVDPGHRKNGTARTLVQQLQDKVRTITANVLFGEASNIGFWVRMGFRQTEINPTMGYIQMQWNSSADKP